MTDLRNLDTIFCAKYEMRPMKKLNIEHDIAITHFDNADCVDCTCHRWRYRGSKVTLLPRYGEITKRFSGKHFTNLICRARKERQTLQRVFSVHIFHISDACYMPIHLTLLAFIILVKHINYESAVSLSRFSCTKFHRQPIFFFIGMQKEQNLSSLINFHRLLAASVFLLVTSRYAVSTQLYSCRSHSSCLNLSSFFNM